MGPLLEGNMDSNLKGRELLELFLELSQTSTPEVRELIQNWIKEFNLDEDKLSTEDLRLLATCYLENVSSSLIPSAEDEESYFMLPQA